MSDTCCDLWPFCDCGVDALIGELDPDDVVGLVAAFRGYVSESCDYCDKKDCALFPEEGGAWICGDCMDAVMGSADAVRHYISEPRE